MAVTVTAKQVREPGWDKNPPAGHAGWNNPVGDRDWIPDVFYNRRFLLKCEGPEVGSVVNWEIYDVTSIPFVADASALSVRGATFVNDEKTKKIWAWQDNKYVNTGSNWVSALRANGPRVVVEMPAYLRWAEGDAETVNFEARAYLPGSFGKEAGKVSVTVKNPDINHVKK